MVASWTIVLMMLGLDMVTALAFKPDLRRTPMMTAKAAESETA
jgi:hypothetical protein